MSQSPDFEKLLSEATKIVELSYRFSIWRVLTEISKQEERLLRRLGED